MGRCLGMVAHPGIEHDHGRSIHGCVDIGEGEALGEGLVEDATVGLHPMRHESRREQRHVARHVVHRVSTDGKGPRLLKLEGLLGPAVVQEVVVGGDRAKRVPPRPVRQRTALAQLLGQVETRRGGVGCGRDGGELLL